MQDASIVLWQTFSSLGIANFAVHQKFLKGCLKLSGCWVVVAATLRADAKEKLKVVLAYLACEMVR